MNRSERLAILIVDDQEDIPEVCEDVLSEQGHQVECILNPGMALRLVKNRLYDVVIVDAKMTYKRAQKGGLLLAEELAGILGTDSLILMSQFEVREEVLELNPHFTFLPKPKGDQSFSGWVEKKLMATIQRLLRRQYGFMVMPYGNEELNRLYHEQLVACMNEAGFLLKRMDEMPGPRAINTELQEKIRQAHFILICASDKNPNVYFEAGFAAALDKFSIICAADIEQLPFDLKSNHVHRLGGSDPMAERQELLGLLDSLRGVV